MQVCSTRPASCLQFSVDENKWDYRIRHKKCDELRPTCSQCLKSRYTCSNSSPLTCPPGTGVRTHRRHTSSLAFVSDSRRSRNDGTVSHITLWPPISNLSMHMQRLGSFEWRLFEYFQVVCASEFELYFETTLWRRLALQMAYNHSFTFHAALAISTLTQLHYFPHKWQNGEAPSKSPMAYAAAQYNVAIRDLKERLKGTTDNAELAIWASVIFATIEFLLPVHQDHRHYSTRRHPTDLTTHLKGGQAILRSTDLHFKIFSPQEINTIKTALQAIQHQFEHFARAETSGRSCTMHTSYQNHSGSLKELARL